MAINKKLIFWKSSTFNPPTSPSDTTKDVLWNSIVFFDSTAGTYANSIWTHGKVFSSGVWGTDQTNYVPLAIGNTTYNLSKDGHTHSYLPLAGGTLTGSSYNILELKRSSANGSSILFSNSSVNLGKIGFITNGDLIIGTGTTTDGVANMLSITSSGIAQFYGNISTSGLVTGTGFSKTGATDAHVLLGNGGHKSISDFNASLVTSTAASGITNVATTNTNTYLNIVQGGASVGSSTQIVGADGVTVASDTTGKLTITGLGAHAGIYSSRASGLGASSNSIEAKDTRSINPLPSTDLQRGVWFDFKTNSAIGLTGASTYSSVVTMVPYGDNSGNSNTSFRLAQSGNNLYFQNWTTVWGTWNKIWHTGNLANGTTAQYIRGDGSLATYTDTTYTTGTLAQLNAGTDTTGRLHTAKLLNDWLNPKLNGKLNLTGGTMSGSISRGSSTLHVANYSSSLELPSVLDITLPKSNTMAVYYIDIYTYGGIVGTLVCQFYTYYSATTDRGFAGSASVAWLGKGTSTIDNVKYSRLDVSTDYERHIYITNNGAWSRPSVNIRSLHNIGVVEGTNISFIETIPSTAKHSYTFTDFSIASATKLQTARTIWGQSFDGTGNVSGAITGATTGVFSSTVQATTAILTNLTANYLPKHTATGLVDSSIYDSNGNIILGGTSFANYHTPAKLNVLGDIWIGDYNSPRKINIEGSIDFKMHDNTIGGVKRNYEDSLNGGVTLQYRQNSVSSSLQDGLTLSYLGNVGISTTTPSKPLTVQNDYATIRLQAETNPSAYFTDITGRYSAAEPFDISINNYGVVLAVGTPSGYSGSSISYMNGYYGSALLGRDNFGVFVDPDGKVGIGTAYPAALLDVNGSMYIRGNQTFAGAGTHYIGGASEGINLSWTWWNGTSDQQWMYLKDGGNVGIGTTDPGVYKLNVNGDLKASSGIFDSAIIGKYTIATHGIYYNSPGNVNKLIATYDPSTWNYYYGGASVAISNYGEISAGAYRTWSGTSSQLLVADGTVIDMSQLNTYAAETVSIPSGTLTLKLATETVITNTLTSSNSISISLPSPTSGRVNESILIFKIGASLPTITQPSGIVYRIFEPTLTINSTWTFVYEQVWNGSSWEIYCSFAKNV